MENNFDEMAVSLESELTRKLDDLAPEKTITITDRKLNPWYNEFIRDQKRIVRSCDKIIKIGKDTKRLYAMIESITGASTSNPLPSGSPEDLAEEFAQFFLDKIVNIREAMKDDKVYSYPNRVPFSFSKFPPLTESEVEAIIMSMQTKSCEIDAIPTTLLKQMLPAIIPTVTKIINISLEHGVFCSTWKEAIVRPLLKKFGLELHKKNYRPVSNLKFLAKLLEHGMLHHLTKHCALNAMENRFLQ